MGSFDSNCCLTGMAIHYKNPIRIGLLFKQEGESMSCYVGDQYQLAMPPVKAIYNDYGNTDWDNIDEQHLPIADAIVKMYAPGLRNHEQYSRNLEIENLSVEETWNAMFHGELGYDPDREKRKAKEEKKEFHLCWDKELFYPFMCHEWAWQALLDHKNEERQGDYYKTKEWKEYVVEQENKRKEQLDIFCMIRSELDAVDNEERFRVLNKELSWVCGSQGGFSRYYKDKFRDNIEKTNPNWAKHRPLYRQLVEETYMVCCKMGLIRRQLMPTITMGMQYEDWEML